MNKIFVFVPVLIWCQILNAQPGKFIENRICDTSEIRIEKIGNRGLIHHDKIYYVQDDMKTISAYTNNQIAWSLNIDKIVPSKIVGRKEIRYLIVGEKLLSVVIGKHTVLKLDLKTGYLDSIISD